MISFHSEERYPAFPLIQLSNMFHQAPPPTYISFIKLEVLNILSKYPILLFQSVCPSALAKIPTISTQVITQFLPKHLPSDRLFVLQYCNMSILNEEYSVSMLFYVCTPDGGAILK